MKVGKHQKKDRPDDSNALKAFVREAQKVHVQEHGRLADSWLWRFCKLPPCTETQHQYEQQFVIHKEK